MVRVLRLLRSAALLAVAFVLGRWSTTELPPAAMPAQLVASADGQSPAHPSEGTPLLPPAAAPAASEAAEGARAEPLRAEPPGRRRVAPPAGKSRPRSVARPQALVAANGPEALADGLLPSEVGTARAGEYAVSIAAFAAKEEARAFCQQLTRRGFHPFFWADSTAQGGGKPYQVRLGRFATQEAAADYSARLARVHIQATVVPPPS